MIVKANHKIGQNFIDTIVEDTEKNKIGAIEDDPNLQ